MAKKTNLTAIRKKAKMIGNALKSLNSTLSSSKTSRKRKGRKRRTRRR